MKGRTFFRIGWTVFIVAATSAPYLANWFSTPPGFRYNWIVPPYPEDSFGYMAWAQQAAHGAWLFKIKYTALPHQPFLFNPFFLICGWIMALFSCDPGVVFFAVKAVGVALFLITFYRYLDYLGLNPIQSTTASILVGVSSGFGGILAYFGLIGRAPAISADLWMPEVSTFWSLMWNPLFPFSLTLMLLSIYWLHRGTEETRPSDLWLSGLATGVLALMHPYSVPMLCMFAAIVVIARERASAVGYLCRYFAASFPFLVYMALASRINPVALKHSTLGEMKSPSLIYYALGFGLPLFLCIAGLAIKRGALVRRYGKIVLWFVLSVTLAYFPFWFQRKLIFGAHIPLCILAGIGFGSIVAKFSSTKLRRWVAIGGLALLLPLCLATPLYLFRIQNKEVRTNKDTAYFVDNDLMEGLRFIKNRSNPDDVVFATLGTSRLIPALSGNTTVWGHWAMSVDFEERNAWIGNILRKRADWDDERRSRDFWGTDIQFIFADGELKQSLEQLPFVWRIILKDGEKVFENGSVVIYQRRKTS